MCIRDRYYKGRDDDNPGWGGTALPYAATRFLCDARYCYSDAATHSGGLRPALVRAQAEPRAWMTLLPTGSRTMASRWTRRTGSTRPFRSPPLTTASLTT
eukprot:1188918-Rhodomonas_salina.1